MYHTTNVLLHFVLSIVVMFIAARLLEWAEVAGRMRTALAIFAGALFLLHPLQTESVAYVASRSEDLSVLFYYAAFAVFIYSNRDSMTLLAGHRHCRLVRRGGGNQGTHADAARADRADRFLVASRRIAKERISLRAAGAGGRGRSSRWCGRFSPLPTRLDSTWQDLSPASYFFTQCRVIWIYIRMFFLPFGQNVDPDIPISTGVMDHGAIFGLIALLALVAAAWIYRKRWPLASFGVFVFLLLIAPTASLVPIRDVLAERRVYLPFLGLILVALELLRRLPFSQAVGTCAAAILACTVLTYQRSDVWSTHSTLWKDTVAKSPERRCVRDFNSPLRSIKRAIARRRPQISKRPRIWTRRITACWWIGPTRWTASTEKTMRPGNLTLRSRRIATLAEAHVGLSMVYGKQKKCEQALEELSLAEGIDREYPADLSESRRGL